MLQIPSGSRSFSDLSQRKRWLESLNFCRMSMALSFSVLTIIAYCFVNVYMQIEVGKARKKYKVYYPILYATEADSKDYKIFSCIQRGHQNSLERLSIFFVLMVLGGLKHPLICSVLGLVYSISRVFYFTGYSSGDPKGRLPIGKYSTIAMLGLAIVNIWSGTSLLMT